MTTTIELIKELMQAHNGHANEGASTFSEAAQRLRELDKPDCVWTPLPFGHGVIVYSPECCPMDSAMDLPMKLTKFCHLCGGAVKEST